MIHIQRNTRLRTPRGTPIIPRCAALVLPHGESPVIVIGRSPVRTASIEQLYSHPLCFGAYGVSGVPYLAIQLGSDTVFSAPLNTFLLKKSWHPFLYPTYPDRPAQVSIALAEGVSGCNGGPGHAPTLTIPASDVSECRERRHPPGTVRALRPAFLPHSVARSLRVLALNERRAFNNVSEVNQVIHRAVKSGFQQRMALSTSCVSPCRV